MKGITLFSDVFSLFVLIGVIMLASVLLWAFIVVYNVQEKLGFVNPRIVELTLLFNPIKYDMTIISLLEYEYNGIPIKKILNAVAIQENTTVWIEGEEIDASIVCENFLSSRIDEPYMLKIIPKQELIIVGQIMPSIPETPLHVQETSTKLFLLDGENVELKLLVYAG